MGENAEGAERVWMAAYVLGVQALLPAQRVGVRDIGVGADVGDSDREKAG